MLRIKELMKRDLFTHRRHVSFLFHPRLIHCRPLRGPSHGLYSLATRDRRGMEQLAR